MVTVRVCSKLKQAENRLFLQMKSGRILDILWAFLIKQLFHTRLLDMRWLQPTGRYAPRWLPTISYPKRTRRMIVKYPNMLQPTEHIYIYECI